MRVDICMPKYLLMQKSIRRYVKKHREKSIGRMKASHRRIPGAKKGLHTTSRGKYLLLFRYEDTCIYAWGHMHICMWTHAYMHVDTCINTYHVHQKPATVGSRERKRVYIPLLGVSTYYYSGIKHKDTWCETAGYMVNNIRTHGLKHEDTCIRTPGHTVYNTRTHGLQRKDT